MTVTSILLALSLALYLLSHIKPADICEPPYRRPRGQGIEEDAWSSSPQGTESLEADPAQAEPGCDGGPGRHLDDLRGDLELGDPAELRQKSWPHMGNKHALFSVTKLVVVCYMATDN